MQSQKWPEPEWITRLPKGKRDRERLAYYLNLAAAFHSPDASLPKLSLALGVGYTVLTQARGRRSVSPELAVKIETLLGRDLFPRELFNPVFIIAD